MTLMTQTDVEFTKGKLYLEGTLKCGKSTTILILHNNKRIYNNYT